jgi:ribose transport system substrate-binding protein
MSVRTRRRQSGVLLAGSVAALVGLGAALGSTASHASQGHSASITPATALAAATAVTAKYSAGTVSWQGPTAAVPFAKNKLIYLIDIDAATQTSQRLISSADQAAKYGNWTIRVIDAQGDPAKWNAAFATAIQAHAAGIIDVAIEANGAEAALAAVKKAGIPVVTTIASTEPENIDNPGITHVVDEHNTQMGYVLGADIVKNTGGHAAVGVLQYPGGVDSEQLAGTQQWFSKNGGGKIVTVANFPITDVGTPALGQFAVALLQAHPNINALWVPWDSPAADAIPAIKAAGLANRVKIYSFYSDSPNLNDIRSHTVETADMSVPLEWEAWAAVDDLNRIFNHQALPKNDGLPFRLLTASNLPPAGQNWTGEFNYQAKYKKLWSVG